MNKHFKPLDVTVKRHAGVARPWLTLTTFLLVPVAALAQSNMPAMDQQGMSNSNAKSEMVDPMDHSKMPGMDRGSMPGMKPKSEPMDHSKMLGMNHCSMPGMKPNAEPMDHSKMPGMDHCSMPGTKPEAMRMDHTVMPAMNSSAMSRVTSDGPKNADMQMDRGAMQGGSPPSDARDPDAYSNGLSMGSMDGMDMADNDRYGQVLIDRLEATHSKDGNGQALDAQAWYGTDLNKLWLKVDGERSNGKLGATRTEVLWNHAIASYWGLQTGLRHDFGDGPGRTWAAFGVQGLSPYWFDVQATAYVGQGGRTAARVEAEYDILFTQRLILQPNVKASFYGRNDSERGIGSGLSDVEAGLRLRYEVSRKFAPYIGVVWKGRFGQTADYAREYGHAVQETQVVAGLRVWF